MVQAVVIFNALLIKFSKIHLISIFLLNSLLWLMISFLGFFFVACAISPQCKLMTYCMQIVFDGEEEWTALRPIHGPRAGNQIFLTNRLQIRLKKIFFIGTGKLGISRPTYLMLLSYISTLAY